MTGLDLQLTYKYVLYSEKLNKTKMPINEMDFSQIDIFNEIYTFAKENYLLVKPTKSQGISNKISERFLQRYLVIKGNLRFELIIICKYGCYRFVLRNKKSNDNIISGIKACKEIYKFAKEYNIDLSKYALTPEEGYCEKKKIESPHIKVLQPDFLDMELDHVYHIDFRSSYASRICEAYPEFKPMYTEIFAMRKDNNGKYKHILTNSIGAWQSPYCVDYKSGYLTSMYQFANLSKTAINGTRAKIIDMIGKLRAAKCTPLLTNTDGIWYYSKHGPYHDENEGDELCNWHNDHVDCKFLMISEGAYQYVENGVCHSVVRGLCSLDAAKPDRTEWEFGDILHLGDFFTYKFDDEKGVIKTNGESI